MNTPPKSVPVAPEPKPPDGRERCDQTQPMDLASRGITLSAPASTHGVSIQGQGLHTSVPQTVNLRTLTEPSKVSFSAVSLRVPTRPATSLAIPTVGHSSAVGTIQSLTTKTGNQVSTLSRHGVNALQTVMSLSGNSNITAGSMASIIRGSHLLPQTVSGHMAHQQVHAQFSSHVPRGPAAVASISAAPKTAVATPILRPAQHSSATVALAVSTASATPAFMPGSSQAVTVGRTATPPIPKVTSPALTVFDFQKQISHGSPGQVHLGVPTRHVEGPLRSTSTTTLPLNKPVNVSQPIVQHLQQIPEKGFYKSTTTVSATIGQNQLSVTPHGVKPAGMVTVSLGHTTTTSSVQMSQHGSPSLPTVAQPRTVASSSVVSLSPAPSVVQTPPLSQHQRQVTANLQSPVTVTTAIPTPVTASAPPPHLAVVSKALPPAIHTVSPIFHPQPISAANKPSTALHISSLVATTSASNTSASTLLITPSVARPTMTAVTPSTTTPASAPIPVAKVYPQPLTSTSSRPVGSTDPQIPDSSATAGFFLAHTSRVSSSTVATTVSNAAPTVGLPTTVVLSDSRNERSVTNTGAPYAVPAYFYEPYVQGTITMHPYGSAQSVQSFSASIPASAALRPGLIAQHSMGAVTSVASAPSSTSSVPTVGNATAVTPVRPLNPVMVSMDTSQRHVTLHPGYQANNSNIVNAEVVVTQGNSTPTLFTVTTTSGSTVGLGFTNQMMSYNPPQSQSTTTNHNTSPRPSILRKRTSDGAGVAVKKSILSSFPLSGPSSPHVEASNLNSASSQSPKPQGATDLPKDLATTPGHMHHEPSDSSKAQNANIPAISIKQEPVETSDNGMNSSMNGSSTTTEIPASSATIEASPRKKPRKQQLAANELLEVQSSDADDDFEREIKEPIKKEPVKEGTEVLDEEKVKRVTFCKRPSMSLLNSYRHTWKSRHNHFIRHTDVKPKEEKKCTVNELANQKGVMQKTNGWKIYHLITQMDEVVELEDLLHGRLSHMLDFIENEPPAMKAKPLNDDEDRILNKINDLIKGNLQRSRIVQDQVAEAKQQVMKVLDHKAHIVNIIGKYVSKRPLKKKEKC